MLEYKSVPGHGKNQGQQAMSDNDHQIAATQKVSELKTKDASAKVSHQSRSCPDQANRKRSDPHRRSRSYRAA